VVRRTRYLIQAGNLIYPGQPNCTGRKISSFIFKVLAEEHQIPLFTFKYCLW